MGPTQVEIEISPNVLDVLTIMPKSEKRFSEELIDKQYGLWNDHSRGSNSNGKIFLGMLL